MLLLTICRIELSRYYLANKPDEPIGFFCLSLALTPITATTISAKKVVGEDSEVIDS